MIRPGVIELLLSMSRKGNKTESYMKMVKS